MTYWKEVSRSIEGGKKLEKLSITLEKWLDEPDDIDKFGEFFASLWEFIEKKGEGTRLLGGSGKARQLTGKALEAFIYWSLKKKLTDISYLNIKHNILLRDILPSIKVSMRPDILISQHNHPLLILSCKIGCGFHALKQIAMENIILRKLGLNIRILVITRTNMQKSHEKRECEDETRIVKEYLKIFYLSIEKKNSERLKEEINSLIEFIKGAITAV